ncbi:hypothetical protein ASPBRDRAFT_47264 [Aspergillus brasiliensis CBS 101740]|uniref:DSBA-like thioredoxin domain-containing protein n=1 Tax=Aspergillus brasiliensis (strain CBS 101740 / IMI 381727 / IBT 21946) TaxID=767769 RepID=A0A1L9U9T2_ASPBC|nr:hypothetical protein ASPBRDRAFT_47264 [Aspergillus brasiliensis CBS 101740]
MALIEITVISDPVCPWCYIGYRRLTKAIHLYQKTYPGGSQDRIRISWKPYFLDRDAPMESITYIERMTQKLGADKVVAAQARLQRLGAQDGIHFNFGGQFGNTLRAHQVMLLSELVSRQGGNDESDTRDIATAVAEGIFRAHFEDELDITDVETLVRIAVQASEAYLDETRVRSWLEQGQGVEEIDEMAARARREGVHGVPCFQIGGGGDAEGAVLTLSGAQDIDEFLRALIAHKTGKQLDSADEVAGGQAMTSC